MTKNKKDIYDITIIGGGPAGLFSSFYAGLREMKVKIIEAQSTLGGKVHVYPQKMIWDVGGMTPLIGKQLINQMIEQAKTFHPTVTLGQKVMQMKKNKDDIFELGTDQGQTHYSRTIVIAKGGGGVISPIKLELPNAPFFEKSNLSYNVPDIQDFKDKVVLISGGGPSAVDWANDIAPLAKKVVLIYRGKHLKAHEADLSKLSTNHISIILNTEIADLKGEDSINKVALRNNETQEMKEIDVGAVLVNHGYHRDNSLFENSDLDIELIDKYFINSHPNGNTSIPGLYAAGDCLRHAGKLGLIAGAFQDAANAVNRAKLYLEPEAQQVAMVSSHNQMLRERTKKILYN